MVGPGLVLYAPFVRDLFSFSSLNPLELLLCVAAALVSILWFGVYQIVRKLRK